MHYPPPKWSKTAQVLMASAALLFSFSLFLALVFAWQEVNQLRERVDQVAESRRDEQLNEDCRDFYQVDLSSAFAQALAANNNMWISVGRREVADTDEERAAQAEDNVRLVASLEESNQPLLSAIDALIEYQNAEPRPEECPHPESIALRNELGD